VEAHSVERKLAAIFAADVAGYSSLMGRDEVGTLRTLTAYRVITDRLIASHRGRIFNTAGDSLVADFASAVDAVQCAVAVQDAVTKENGDRPAGGQMRFRIGVHVGDIMVQGDNLFGDAVNVAARLEALAEPGGICVSRVVRDQVRDKLPFSFEDMGEQQVKNITRPIRVHRIVLDEKSNRSKTATSEPQQNPPLALPDKPSIAVLPFQNMSGDPEQEYFADGMVEEIITALSRIRWLFVIARNSSFTYKGRSVDVTQVSRELGVRYVLEGSVRKAGQRVRITGQLIDAVTGAHLWAERFDGSLEDIFELQDKVAVSVAGVIEPTLQAAEILRSSERPTSDLTAYDLYLRALSHGYTWEKGGTLAALDLARQAIERDPQYGPVLALAANCQLELHVNGWTNDPVLNRHEGIYLARQALRVASDDPRVLGMAAYTLAYFGEDIDAAIELIDRALTLNPSFARGWLISGWLRLWAGQPEPAIGHFETSVRLNPHARRADIYMSIGVGHFFAQRFGDATAMLLRSLQEHAGWAPTYRFLATCYAHMGQLGEARETIERLKAVTPVVVPNAMHWRNPEHRELFLSGLRLAAGETT
jgi:adenylate cyclase